MFRSASPLGARVVAPAAVLAAGLALAACRGPHPHAHARQDHPAAGAPMRVAEPLACPPAVGGLARTAQAADGQSCAYRGRDGEQVSLQRLAVPAGQTPQAALAPIEAGLRPLVPARAGPAPVSVDAGDDDNDDHAKVDLPGIHVDAHGDKADVRVFGVKVNADGDNANVNVGQGDSRAVVRAGPDGAEIRAADVDAANAKLVLILAADRPGPAGVRAAGYIAEGPAKGPLAVAVFKSAAPRNNWRGDRDLNGLLELNVKQ